MWILSPEAVIGPQREGTNIWPQWAGAEGLCLLMTVTENVFLPVVGTGGMSMFTLVQSAERKPVASSSSSYEASLHCLGNK